MAQLFNQYYINSPNFPPIIREKKDAVRDIDPSLIPTKKIKKRKFHFIETNPSDIFDEIVKDSRGSLPNNKVLQSNVNIFFKDKLASNLSAVYENDVRLFEELEKDDNYHLYEKYIYMLSLITYINSNAGEIKGKLNNDAEGIIEWGQLRDDKSLSWRLEGPTSPTTSEIDFVKHYNMLISTANETNDLVEQTKVSKLNMLYDGISNLRKESTERPNSFDKELDLARQYYVIIRDERNLLSEVDTNGNLMFDASNLDLGDVSHNKTEAQFNSIIVSQDKVKSSPSKMAFKSIQQLFTNFSSIAVHNFSLAHGLFENDISKFPTVFLVFPGIHTTEHTVIGNISRGVLRIAGRFINDVEKRRYVFQPNEDMTTFDGSQTFVQNMMFYITTSESDTGNNIIGNPLMRNFILDDIYNHLITTNISQEYVEQIQEMILENVEYDIPTEISELYESKVNAFVYFINNLEFVPTLIKEYMNRFPAIYQRYKSLVDEVGDFIPTSLLTASADNLISSSKITEFNQMKELEDNHRKMMQLLSLLNNSFSKYKSAVIGKNNLYTTFVTYSTIDTFQRFIASYRGIIDFNSLRVFISNLCNLSTDSIVDVDATGAGDKYLKIINDIATNVNRFITKVKNPVTIKINPFNGGRIDNLEFRIENRVLTFVYTEGNYNLVSDSENDMVIITFYNDNFKQLPVSSFVYSPSKQMLQYLSYNPTNISKIPIFDTDIKVMRKIYKEGDYYYIRGGFEEVKVYNDGDELFAKLTDFTENYEEAIFSSIDRELRFIKYLPQQYMNYDLIPLKIFDFVDSEITIYVDNSRRLFVEEGRISTGDSYFIEYTHFHFKFLLEAGYVTEIQIYFCHNRNSDTFTSDEPIIKIRTNPYATLCLNENIDISGRTIDISNITFEKVATLFNNDNCFKAYRCTENMLQKQWSISSILNGIISSPITTDSYRNEEIIMHFIVTKSDNCLIYTIGETKEYYNMFIANNQTMIVDTKITTDPVYVYESQDQIYEMNDEVELEEETVVNVMSIQFTITTVDNKIEKIKIGEFIIESQQFKEITIIGTFDNEVYYSLDYGSFMIRYEDGKIKQIILIVSYSSLRQYLFVNGVVKCRNLFHFDGKLSSASTTASISTTTYNYHKVLPYVKYWQRNLVSDSYATNGYLNMVIRNENNLLSNVRVNIQKHKQVTIDNANDMDIVKSIPYTMKLMSEQIDDKLVIFNVKNDSVIADGGYICIYDANMIYLSLNIK